MRQDIASAEAEMRIRAPARVADKLGPRRNRINRMFRQENRIIIRNRESENLVESHAGTDERAIHPAQKAERVRLVGAVPKRGLFHRTANLTPAGEFGDVIK